MRIDRVGLLAVALAGGALAATVVTGALVPVSAAAAAAAAAGGEAAAAGATTAQQCAAAFRIPHRSFRSLDARNSAVWIDAIDSIKQRPYVPFQIAVVVGSAYPPFKADSGRLDRVGFESLMRSAYGVTRANTMVSDAALKKAPVVVSFTSGKQPFSLKVLSVTAGKGDSVVTLQLCR